MKILNDDMGGASGGKRQIPLYRAMLGSAWMQLPEQVRVLHDWSDGLQVTGRAEVERGGHWLARCLAMLFGFPKAGEDVPVQVRFTGTAEGETWRRSFAGNSFCSHQSQGRGDWQGLLCERFGPFAVALALVVRGAKLYLEVRHWSFLGVPLPAIFAPGGTNYEYVEDGRFHFHVEIRQPSIGLLVRYRGWLVPETGRA